MKLLVLQIAYPRRWVRLGLSGVWSFTQHFAEVPIYPVPTEGAWKLEISSYKKSTRCETKQEEEHVSGCGVDYGLTVGCHLPWRLRWGSGWCGITQCFLFYISLPSSKVQKRESAKTRRTSTNRGNAIPYDP